MTNEPIKSPQEGRAPTAHLSYRPDIDGLRAIAVLSVVIYHAFPEYLAGGFIGVDIFFVISGFLISTIIFKSVDAGHFSYADFYSRRVRRIFPALGLVLASTLLIGWHTLFANEWEQLGLHTLGGAFFAANFLLWRESGYFDVAAEVKPLLHLWSLSIEEQFYIFFPWLAVFFYRTKIWTKLLLGLSLLSFAAGLFSLSLQPVAAFYAPWNRFWEILLGSLLANYLLKSDPAPSLVPKVWQHATSLLGLALIAWSLLTMSHTKSFPGLNALWPCLGAMLLILSGPNACINRYVLSLKPMIWIGLISYPLYLWHWPLLSIARILKRATPSLELRSLLVLVSLLLAWGTYQLLEKSLRRPGKNTLKVSALCTAVALLGFFGYGIHSQKLSVTRGLETANPFSKLTLQHATAYQRPGCGPATDVQVEHLAYCVHDERGTPSLAIIGDSKAKSLLAGLIQASDPETRVMLLGGAGSRGAPLPVLSEHPIYEKFKDLTEIALQQIVRQAEIKVVVFVAATRNLYDLKSVADIRGLHDSPYDEQAENGLIRAIQYVRDHGKKVVLLTDNPTLPDPRECVMRTTALSWLNAALRLGDESCQISIAEHRQLADKYLSMLQRVAQRFPHDVRVVDATEELCQKETQLCTSTLNGRLLYIQTDHLSDFGAERVGRQIIPAARELMGLSPVQEHSQN